MTEILKNVCGTIVVVLSTIFLPVRILIGIILGIIGFPIFVFGSRFEIGVKEYFVTFFNGFAMGLKDWWGSVTEFYEKD